MSNSFFEHPILNSPYEEPTRYHNIDDNGHPIGGPPKDGRRRSELKTPTVPTAKKQKAKADEKQGGLDLRSESEISTDDQAYDPFPIINEIRGYVQAWRKLPSSRDWGVTPTTARLLTHWRDYDFNGVRPFFCQIEAVETIIWLTEVAPKLKSSDRIRKHIVGANEMANPGLMRMAMKMATGSGKTTVMAMLIAWHAINAARSPSSKTFTRGFLIIAPGITIKDRLRVLQPNDAENYYFTRELVPAEMRADLNKARIVITNYHAFQLRDVLEVNKTSEALLQGRGEPIRKKQTEGQMVRTIASELMGLGPIAVINDEAHHCYREKPGSTGLEGLKGDERKDADEENKAARVWINGIEAFNRQLGKHEDKRRRADSGVRVIYDLSATPFFLSGSGWAQNTLFPWTVSDFSLLDAIESGIVKLPRVPVSDNLPEAQQPVFRDLWTNIGKRMPKAGAAKGGGGDPMELPDTLKTAFFALYDHYKDTFDGWKREGINEPPVFIVVCNNTSTSKLVYEWISGWQRPNEDGEEVVRHVGHLDLFSNFDEYEQPLAKPNTLLIDSRQIESGELKDDFRKMASSEIDRFKSERRLRGEFSEISDAELLREVMNTVGKEGRLGEQIRCVVSVSMLTEGWDTNNVTHILGIRAFGTQLLCEQVVGRALRRYSYDLNPETGLFDPEYADILGIPFDFTANPVVAPPKPPVKTTRVAAVKERIDKEITFPRVAGYRIELPEERLTATFTEDHKFTLTPQLVGPGQTVMQGVVGKHVLLSTEEAQECRPSKLVHNIAAALMQRKFRDENGELKTHLFHPLKRIVKQWLDRGYFECVGGTGKWMAISYVSVQDLVCEKILKAIVDTVGDKENVSVVLDPYNPKGSTRHVGFQTKKNLFITAANKCHINYVVEDSSWEGQFAGVVETNPKVISYVKNQGLGFEIPYKQGSISRLYVPDFIVQIDDGRGPDDPLNLIVEVKGYRREDVKDKENAVKDHWLPGVNALGTYGRWAFDEFNDPFKMDEEFANLIDRLIGEN